MANPEGPAVDGCMCGGCHFYGVTSSRGQLTGDCYCPDHIDLICGDSERKDGLSVIFEKIAEWSPLPDKYKE